MHLQVMLSIRVVLAVDVSPSSSADQGGSRYNHKAATPRVSDSFSSSCHLDWPFPDHSWPSSALSELPAHTTSPQNKEIGGVISTSGGEDPLASFGRADFVRHPLAEQILFLSAGSSSLPDPSLPSCPPKTSKPTMQSILIPVQLFGSQHLCCIIKITSFCHPGPKHLSGAPVKGLNTQGLLQEKKNSPFSQELGRGG